MPTESADSQQQEAWESVLAAVPILQGLQPPTGVNLTSKRKAENWKAYKQRWTNYAIVTQLEKQSEEYRVAFFLYCIANLQQYSK